MMRSGLAATLLLATLAIAAIPRPAAASTAEERKWAVETARWLEEHPLDPQAKARRTELLTWWISVPDITLSACPLLLEAKNKRIGPAVAAQAMFSTGAYVIEHSDATRADQVLAGVEGALRAYENAVKGDEGSRDRFLDELVAAKAAGKLKEAYVDRAVQHCEEPAK